jgi:hypothetical protein
LALGYVREITLVDGNVDPDTAEIGHHESCMLPGYGLSEGDMLVEDGPGDQCLHLVWGKALIALDYSEDFPCRNMIADLGAHLGDDSRETGHDVRERVVIGLDLARKVEDMLQNRGARLGHNDPELLQFGGP